MNAVVTVSDDLRPQMHAVKSSNAAAIGYTEDGPGALYVEFASKRAGEPGPVWRYSPVSRRDFEALLNGESVGKFVGALKRDSSITAERVLHTEAF